jgi:hypothetical protein
MEILTKVIIPVCTFFLGIVFTLAIKRYEQKKAALRQHIEETVTHVNAWYNQLHSLTAELRSEKILEEAEARIYLYVSNRLILPKLLLSVGVLKRHKASELLINDVEDFLRLVTTYHPSSPEVMIYCPHVRPNHLPLKRASDKDSKILEELLPQLDSRLQRISNEAAKLLAG